MSSMKITFIRNVFPGDTITEGSSKDDNSIKSFGIFNNKATIAGQLSRIDNLYFIKSKTNKYCPMKYDIVIGRIVYNSVDYYKVDLGNVIACLSTLAFVNATKKNKPELQKGDHVLCQVIRTEGDLLLTCNQQGLGKINEAHPIESWKVRYLYFSDLLQKAGKQYNFKIAMAMNGYLWIEAEPADKRMLLKIFNELELPKNV